MLPLFIYFLFYFLIEGWAIQRNQIQKKTIIGKGEFGGTVLSGIHAPVCFVRSFLPKYIYTKGNSELLCKH